MTTPNTTYDYHMITGEQELKKQREVLGQTLDPADYETRRIRAKADDGTDVPMSMVYRKDTPQDGSAPLVLYGYGSYGMNMDPYFSSVRLSLLDRGFTLCDRAHPRRSGDWGENGMRRGSRSVK
ncbi:MAG: hypothetical protein U5N26_02555 [Candidatus Marinimicrobia bacterium]|nr:hypothetical protein [Candidatus Neomarinimicrobiota bacterium]